MEDRRLLAAAGTLDPTFSTDGKVTASFGSLVDQGNAVAIQSDGKIVVAGFTTGGLANDFAVARFNADGSLDTTFDGDGLATVHFGLLPTSSSQATSIAIQADGKIVLAGFTVNGTANDIAIARLNANGSLDTTFDGDGMVTAGSLFVPEQANGVAIQSDGRIVVAGFAGTTHNFALARFNTNGSLDTTLGGTGLITTPVGTSGSEANSIALQTDGKIVAGGFAFNGIDNDFALARYNANGTLDTSFNGAGTVLTPIGTGADQANAIALQTDGKIVAAGFTVTGTNNDFALARYNTNGSLDTTFSGDGKVTTDFSLLLADVANAVAVQADGKIVAAGVTLNVTSNDFALARYNADGTLDATFGTGGLVRTDISGTLLPDQANGIAIQTDGKIVAAGYTLDTLNGDFAVARYIGANRPAVITPIPDQTVAVGNTLTFTVSATDPDGDPLVYSASNLPAGATFNPATHVFTWTPTAAQGPGQYTPVFTVTDGVQPVSATAHITVTGGTSETNRAPVLAPIGDKTIGAGSTLTFTVLAIDPDGNPITYSASGLPAGATFDPATRTFTWTPTAAQAGPHTVTFSASDGQLTDSDPSVITVTTSANRPPVFTPIPDQTVAVGTNLTFTVSATDPDGTPLVYSATNLPAGATFDPATHIFSWTPAANQGPGNYTPVFSVTDGVNTVSTPAQVAVTGGNNSAPILAPIGDKAVAAGTNLTFTVSATDADGDPIVFSADDLPAGTTFDPATRTFSWTPTLAQGPGNYPITLIASDGKLFDSETIHVAVTGGTNRPPVLDPIGDKTVEEGTTLSFTLTASDPDGNPLTFSAIGLPPNATLDPNTGAFRFSPTAAQGPACFQVTFFVSDGGLNDSETIHITVTEGGFGPAVRLFRAYHRGLNYHFFTTSFVEFATAVSNGYEDETSGRGGIGVFAAQAEGTVPVHRLYNPNKGTHYYTLDTNERDFLVSKGWIFEKDEGFMFMTDADCVGTIFRLYNNDSGVHLFTESVAVRNKILEQFPGIWVEHSRLGFGFALKPEEGIRPPVTGAGSQPAVAAAQSASAGERSLPVQTSGSDTTATSTSLTGTTGAAQTSAAATAAPTEVASTSPAGSAAGDDSAPLRFDSDEHNADADPLWQAIAHSLLSDPLHDPFDLSAAL